MSTAPGRIILLLASLLVWAVIGVIAGAIANVFAPEHGMGAMLNGIIGCIGALVGPLALSLALPQQTSLSVHSIPSAAMALLTAGIFLSITHFMTLDHGGHSNH